MRLLHAWLPLAPWLVLSVPAAAQAGPGEAGAHELRVAGQRAAARIWEEPGPAGERVPHYRLSLDGERFGAAVATSYELGLRFARFDPRTGEPEVPAGLRAGAGSRLFVVQYWTQVLEDWRAAVRAAGGTIHLYLANHANVVELDPAALARVRALPIVRAVRPFHPAYKLEEELLAALQEGRGGALTVNLLTLRRGGHAPVVAWLTASGATIEHVSEPTHLLTATLDLALLPALAALDEVQWIDRWFPPEADLNIARTFHGANAVEANHGVTGTGVRVEVMDGGFDTTHPDMPDFLIHNGNSPDAHGTCTAGIVVGDGSIQRPGARGIAPDAFLVVSDYGFSYAGGSRYNHTGRLANPALPFQCVLQSNSWGGGLTTSYTSTSQNMDLILFDHARISICQSQSNAGTQNSRPEAWAKNIISVGGIRHNDTLTKNDDSWSGGASIGPAADGRIKPDLASFYDGILCTDMVGGNGYSSTNYTTSFGGTSGATPIVAGHLALVYEMWHLGLFGNDAPGATPFENAPNNTTAKALLIHSASQWTFSGTSHDLTRTRQGWGHPDLARLSQATARMLVVDEADVLSELQSQDYVVEVLPGEAELRATLVYRDPPGTTSSSTHRINDLDLVLTSPSAVVYRGNVGLASGNWSTAGGTKDSKNTVENVLLQAPEAGLWTVTVTAADVNQDAHVETPAVDVDFALVVSGAEPPPPGPPAAPDRLEGRALPSTAQLTFRDNSTDELGFELERSLDGTNFLPLVTLPAGDTHHIDAGLAPNTDYHYRVRATNSAGPSAWSNVATVRTIKATSR
ncbi:MAG TPA: S8 family serine peptidase [Planctomycetota bacterium]